jgi:hypothetical protein
MAKVFFFKQLNSILPEFVHLDIPIISNTSFDILIKLQSHRTINREDMTIQTFDTKICTFRAKIRVKLRRRKSANLHSDILACKNAEMQCRGRRFAYHHHSNKSASESAVKAW